MALVLAVKVRPDGYREVLGWDIGHVEYEAFWTAFLHQLVRRGLREVHPVTRDAHEGLKEAMARILAHTAPPDGGSMLAGAGAGSRTAQLSADGCRSGRVNSFEGTLWNRVYARLTDVT